MKHSEKVRRSLMHLIRVFGFENVPDLIRKYEDMGIYDEDYADDLLIAYMTLKKRRTPRTKYNRFHPYQEKLKVDL